MRPALTWFDRVVRFPAQNAAGFHSVSVRVARLDDANGTEWTVPGSLDAPVYAEIWLPLTSSAPQPDRDSVKSIVYDLAFRPDGTQIVAAVGNRVLVYDAADGDLLHSLKGELQPPFRSFAPVIQPTCLQGTRPQCTPWHTHATENASPPAGWAPKFNVWLAQSLRMAAMRRDWLVSQRRQDDHYMEE